MSNYRKRHFFRPTCEYRGCKKNATCHVEHRRGQVFGTYCEDHADAKIKSLDEYDTVVASLSTGGDGA